MRSRRRIIAMLVAAIAAGSIWGLATSAALAQAKTCQTHVMKLNYPRLHHAVAPVEEGDRRRRRPRGAARHRARTFERAAFAGHRSRTVVPTLLCHKQKRRAALPTTERTVKDASGPLSQRPGRAIAIRRWRTG